MHAPSHEDLAEGISYAPPLPVEGYVEVDVPVGLLWETFLEIDGWHTWNPCFFRSWVRGGGRLRDGAEIVLVFNAIRPWLPYKLPGPARVVAFEPERRVTWAADTLGFRARHSYLFEPLGATRSRFGSFEVAEGPAFRALHRFWIAHFEFVCRESLAGARRLAD